MTAQFDDLLERMGMMVSVRPTGQELREAVAFFQELMADMVVVGSQWKGAGAETVVNLCSQLQYEPWNQFYLAQLLDHMPVQGVWHDYQLQIYDAALGFLRLEFVSEPARFKKWREGKL